MQWGEHKYLKLSEQPLNRGHRKRLPIVKVKYKMETGLENFLSRQNPLSHVSQLNAAYFMDISKLQLRLFLVKASDYHKRNLNHLPKNGVVQSPFFIYFFLVGSNF